MKKTLAVLVAIGLAGCSTGPSKEESFLETMRAGYPQLESYPDDKLVEAGKETCQNIDKYGVAGTFAISMELVGDPGLAGAFIGASVPAFCPEHQDEMLHWANS